MKEIFAALAALFPIGASLWVAGAALLRNLGAKKRLAELIEIEEQYREDINRFTEEQHQPPGPPGPLVRYVRADDPPREQRRNGRDPEWKARVIRRAKLEALGVSYRDYRIEAPARSLLEEQPLSSRQSRDQWCLIIASVIGVVLLAASVLSPSISVACGN